MNFILAVDAQGKHTLYLNRSNTPKEVLKDQEISELEVDTEKPKLMAFIQVMLDMIHAKQEPEDTSLLDVKPVEATVSLKPQIEEMENSVFRRLVEARFHDQPLSWRLDMSMLAMEDARNIINPLLYQRITDDHRT